MKKIIVLLTIFYSSIVISQYDINSFNYGFVGVKTLGKAEEAGIGVRMEYAKNCATTFLGEYNRLLILDKEGSEGYNEIGVGVNLILFNWYPTTITAGIGYIVNDSPIFEKIEKKAYLFFRTGDFNHGAQIKLRALHKVTESFYLFTELNIKSLGRRYDTVVVGFNYDFY